jgi:hypothetical protein
MGFAALRTVSGLVLRTKERGCQRLMVRLYARSKPAVRLSVERMVMR